MSLAQVPRMDTLIRVNTSISARTPGPGGREPSWLEEY
jgi:hypothetical protein